MASALDMIAGLAPGQGQWDPYADFQEGRAQGLANAARPLMGKALQGDSNALNSLAGIDPQGFMEVSGFQDKRQKAADEKADALSERVAAMLNWADTPEKWQVATQRIQANGIELEPQELDFNNRGAMLAEYQTIKEQRAQANVEREFGLKDRDFNADEAYRGASLDIERQKLAQGGGGKLPSGYRFSANGNMEFIPGGPADPSVKASQGAGGVTTKMRNDAVGVNQAYNNLNTALDDYGALIKKTGVSALPGEENDAIKQSRTNLQLQMKELYNLGVLNGPDLGLMQQMIFDPQVSALNPIDAMAKAYGETDLPGSKSVNVSSRAEASIARVKDMLKTIRDNKTAGILDAGGNFVGGGQQQQTGMAEPMDSNTMFDEVGQIPEGAVVEDEAGNRYQKVNGTLEAVQ